MKKIYLFMLMAVGLLISGNVFGAKGQGHPEPQQGDVAKVSVDVEGVVTTTYYATLQNAFDDLPDNSYPATLTLLDNTPSTYENSALKIIAHQNVTIDLNNFTIAASTNLKGGTSVIENRGTLTIEDNSQGGNGQITNIAYKPDVEWGGEGQKQWPGYASNVITNYGTLIVNSGTIESTTGGAATYCVDNSSNGGVSPLFILNGGTLRHTQTTAVRLYCNSSTGVSQMEMNGGTIEAENGSSQGIWIHLPSGDSKISEPARLVINGGLIKAPYPLYVYSYGAKLDKVDITITGGDFNGTVYFGDGIESVVSTESIKISGGIFRKMPVIQKNPENHEGYITGGIFCDFVTPGLWSTGVKGNKTDYPTPEAFLEYVKTLNLRVIDYADYAQGYTRGYYFAYVYDDPTTGQLTRSNWSNYSDFPGCTVEMMNEAFKKLETYEYETYWLACFRSPVKSPYEAFQDNDQKYIAEGFKAIPISGVDGTEGNDLIIAALRRDTIKVDGEQNLSDLDPTANDTTEITIVPNSGENAIINITEDTKVNKIDVVAPDGKGEAQIVVKNGVTLDVGNGGVVSENDILTTILVETGGTLIIGTGGIDKEGAATPIEIKAGEEKGTGSLIFSPNAKHEDTKNYAEVDLYTYCKKIGEGKYTWQQFAIPVTGLTNEKVVKTPNKTSYVFEWDYATYSWSQLNNWAQLDEPFAGYDLTNISENGGVVYTFKGNLIGNQNIQLTLPHKDYCVMGNSYTAPIDIAALFEQISKEMNQSEGNETIEKTIYKYNAKSRYYEYINELGIILNNLGIAEAPFTNIKPMEGFLLNLQNGNTAGVMLNYANAVYTPATTPKPATAPRMANTDMVVAKISIQGAHAMDQMTLVESDEFSAEIENGKDAFKYLNEGANLYAFDGTNKLAMVATDNLEGTMLAFQAAEDAEYTLTFDRALNADYSLLDLLTGESIEMVEGNTYTFYATPNTLNPSRFMVVATAKAPTSVENIKVNEGAKGIYTIMGQYIGTAEMWNEMPQGVYMVNGVKVIK